MTIVWNLIKAFLVGGALCMIGEILLLKTKLTPARILVGYIVAGVFLSAIGVYAPLAQFAGAGASVPLTGFGHALVTGARGAGNRHLRGIHRRSDEHGCGHQRRGVLRGADGADFPAAGERMTQGVLPLDPTRGSASGLRKGE